MPAPPVTLDDVQAARERLGDAVVRTPLLRVDDVLLKAELFQHTGSFKPRGALAKLTALTPEERRRGVITISAGNHALGVAFAAAREGVDALVLTWRDASPVKLAAARALGAVVDSTAPDVEAAYERLHELIEQTGRVYIDPHHDAHVLAGHGTVGLELVEDAAELDVVVVPVGGGGLVGGIATAVRALRPEARIVAVEPELAPTLHTALRAGEPVSVTASSVADGLNAPRIGANALELCRVHGVESVLVSEDEIREAFRFLYGRAKLAVEPAGAAATAALRSGKVALEPGETVAAIASGGNVVADKAAAILVER